jgi:hypothetical protein
VFGNLFRKKSRKPSKDDETGREEETADAKAAAITVVAVEQESNEKDDSLRNDWDASTQSREVEKIQSAMTVGADGLDDDARLPIISAEKESVILYFLFKSLSIFRRYSSRLHPPRLMLILRDRCRLIRVIKVAALPRRPCPGPIHPSIPSWTTIRAYETHLFSFMRAVA